MMMRRSDGICDGRELVPVFRDTLILEWEHRSVSGIAFVAFGERRAGEFWRGLDG